MRKLRLFLLLLLFTMLLGGCKNEQIPVDGTVVYHMSKDGTAIIPVAYEITGDSPEVKVEELLAKLEEVPESVDLRRTIPENVKILSYTLDRKQLYLDFNEEYSKLDKATEVLVRAAIVKTMVQVEEVSFVGIRVMGETLKDSKGSSIGLMNENTFLDNMGSEEHATKIVNLNLYFANKNGDKLRNQSTVIEYNANVALEKVVVEQLIAGPTEKEYYPTIPKDTKLMSITTKDGVCYVNLDTGFTVQGYDVLGMVTIYSIVNSLTELPGISDVQILVNGESNIKFQESVDLSEALSRNYKLI